MTKKQIKDLSRELSSLRLQMYMSHITFVVQMENTLDHSKTRGSQTFYSATNFGNFSLNFDDQY